MLVTAYFATVVKFLLFALFCYLSYHFNVSNIVDFAAVCSLVIGSIATLRQTEIKRFIAYSSIAHVGFLLIGDLTSGFVYILTYLISSLAFFSVLLSTNNNGRELVYLNDLIYVKGSGLFKPAVLIISLASMAGLPPFAGFYGKFLI
jgi:NADH-quinone oxidoreductase subunit N